MSQWTKAREFSTQFEAEMARARLQSANIPSTIKSHESGFFGAGFQGVVPSGVELHVPRERLSEVQTILDDSADPHPT